MSSVKDEVLIAFIDDCERTDTLVNMSNFIYWLFENYNLTKK